MARRAILRASDADRESVAEQLRRAGGEGRLRTDELERRVGAALSASTYGDLDALVADLPRSSKDGWSVRRRRSAGRVPRGIRLLVAVPIALLIVASVVLAVTGVLAAWWVWAIVGWLWFGRMRRRSFAPRQLRGGCGGWAGDRSASRGSRTFWA
jgi:DUF1707 SHOCT-like domain